MAAILQTEFSNAFYWMNTIIFWLQIEIYREGQIDGISAMVQVMVLCQLGNKPLFKPVWPSAPMHMFVTRPQYAKSWSGTSMANDVFLDANDSTSIHALLVLLLLSLRTIELSRLFWHHLHDNYMDCNHVWKYRQYAFECYSEDCFACIKIYPKRQQYNLCNNWIQHRKPNILDLLLSCHAGYIYTTL